MQASQRAQFNHALEYAIEQANELKLPVVVCFGLMDGYPEANARHYTFMLQGLRNVFDDLRERGIRFVVKHGASARVALHYAKDAAMVVCDRGYTRHQKAWREEVARAARCWVVQVESDVVVPVEVASDKLEFAARTIRSKIQKKLAEFLKSVKAAEVKRPSLTMRIHGDVDVSEVERTLAMLKLDRSVAPSQFFIGGSHEAHRRLREFVTRDLKHYDDGRRDLASPHVSHLSPYLQFGQISPIEIALAVKSSEAFLEQLIVRRELAVNFVRYHPRYDTYEALPTWAKVTLKQHAKNRRAIIYSLAPLEHAQTHDRYWNAAQKEMTLTGYMHNSMRMYWGKKIIEWTRSPKTAFKIALHLNNKYFIDGRGPNAFANVAWLFGLHDRPWGRRKIFGTVRYMNAAGLERKFDMDAYVKRVEGLDKNVPQRHGGHRD
jgi:deoxyribodipyrimidine photo-lyase